MKAYAVATWLLACAPQPVAALTPDDQVLFLPTTARVLADGRIEARIEAWVYQNRRRPGLTRLLASYLDLDVDALSAVDRERFYARSQLFRVDSENGESLRVDVGEQHFALPRTAHGGRSSARLLLNAEAAPTRWLRFKTQAPAPARSTFRGRALIVPLHGLSVVSDIDDTIKISNVRDRHELLLNTFAREFVPVPGMAERYGQWAQLRSTRFHYVSSGPIQLYTVIARFLADQQFPQGSVHLRESTSVSDVLAGHGESRAHKLAAIGRLLADYPERKFLLIGDSGEADPEIYGQLARAHPEQVAGIRIRDVSAEPAAAPRYARAFAGLDARLWQVYTDPARMASAP